MRTRVSLGSIRRYHVVAHAPPIPSFMIGSRYAMDLMVGLLHHILLHALTSLVSAYRSYGN